jgi:hypothetical protein
MSGLANLAMSLACWKCKSNSFADTRTALGLFSGSMPACRHLAHDSEIIG